MNPPEKRKIKIGINGELPLPLSFLLLLDLSPSSRKWFVFWCSHVFFTGRIWRCWSFGGESGLTKRWYGSCGYQWPVFWKRTCGMIFLFFSCKTWLCLSIGFLVWQNHLNIYGRSHGQWEYHGFSIYRDTVLFGEEKKYVKKFAYR